MEQQQETPASRMTATPKVYWDPERDRPRGKELVRVEVVNRSTLNLQIPRGTLLQPGKQEADVYIDELPVLEGQVEPNPIALAQAAHSCRLAIANEAKARVDGFSGTADEFLKRVDRRDQAELEAYEYVRARTSLSPEGMFRQTMLRDPLPLESVTVKERNLAEPQRESVKLLQAEQNRYTQNLGAAIADGIAQAQQPMIAAFAALTEKLTGLLNKKQ